jgi:N-acetylglucosamine kinase-like BadF-type ATPase
LTAKLLEALGGEKPMDLIPAVYRGGWDRTALASLAPLVLDSAQQGDEVAGRIVARGAHQLALTVAAAAMRLELPPDRLPVAITGGTILCSEHYRKAVLQGLDKLGIHADPVTLVHEPAEGGVRLARQSFAAE